MSFKLNIENYNSSKTSNIYLFFILLLTFASFYSVFNHEFLINWDDGAQVVNNADIKNISFSGIKKIFSTYYVGMYQPITTLTYTFDYAVYGLSSQGFHFSNLLYHFIAIIMVFIFLSKIFDNRLLIFFLTLLFSVHPTNVETVAWISARSNILFTIFYIAGLIFYLKYLQKQKKIKYFFITFLFYGLSCLSKSAAITFPIVLLLFDVFFDKITLRKIIEKIPFFIISIVIGLLTIDARINNADILDLSSQYNSTEVVLSVLYSIFMFIKLFFIPYNNSAFYIYPEKNENVLPFEFYISLLLFAASFVILLIILYKRNKKVIFGLLFFLISLFVMLKFIATGMQFMADRYIYLPMLGILIAIGYLTQQLLKKYLLYSVIVLCVITTSYIYRTVSYSKYWENEEALFSQTIKTEPNAVPCKNLLGVAYRKRGNTGEALNLFNEIIKKYPKYGNTYNNRGNLYKDIGEFEKAINDYNMALLYQGEDEEIYTNMGIVYAMKNDFQSAFQYFNKAIAKNKNFYLAYFNRGKAYAIKGNFNNALNDLNIAISINPDFAMSYYTRGMVYYSLGKKDESNSDLKIAKELGVKIAQNQIK